MKTLATLLLTTALIPAAHAASPMTKPGLWEVHVIKQVIDGKDMAGQIAAAQAKMQEQMAKMTPAQRQQMEQMMGGHKMPTGNTQRLCISADMASRDKPIVHTDSKCEPVKHERSGNKTTFELNCTADGHTTVGKGESVVDGDSITTRMDMTVTDAQGKHTIQSESQMKYLGSDCQGVKPMDQILKDLQAIKKPQ